MGGATKQYNIETIERFKVTADIISILIHNNTIQSFVWSSIEINILVSLQEWLVLETMEKWRFQRYIGHATLLMEGHLKLRIYFI